MTMAEFDRISTYSTRTDKKEISYATGFEFQDECPLKRRKTDVKGRRHYDFFSVSLILGAAVDGPSSSSESESDS